MTQLHSGRLGREAREGPILASHLPSSGSPAPKAMGMHQYTGPLSLTSLQSLDTGVTYCVSAMINLMAFEFLVHYRMEAERPKILSRRQFLSSRKLKGEGQPLKTLVPGMYISLTGTQGLQESTQQTLPCLSFLKQHLALINKRENQRRPERLVT